MQNKLIEACRKWIRNYHDANLFVTSNKLRLQMKIDNVRMLIEKAEDLDVENPSAIVVRKFESMVDAIERVVAETVVDSEQDSYKIEVIRYAQQSTLINSEIEANLVNVSAEIRKLVRAWMEQNWESRYSSWGPLFAILAEDGIPIEHRSKPIAKNKAARLLGRTGDEGRAVEWLNKCINDGTYYCVEMTRQTFCFDIRQFPEDKHPQLRP